MLRFFLYNMCMKKGKLLIPIFTSAVLAESPFSLLTSCKNENKPPVDTKCTLTFVAGEHGRLLGETTVEVEKDTLWKDITTPTTKCSAGYRFNGWYNGDTKLDDPEYKIQYSMTIQAHFEEIFIDDIFVVKDGILEGFDESLSQGDIDKLLGGERALPIPNDVTAIGDKAFSATEKRLVMPENILSISWPMQCKVTHIGQGAFYRCLGLKSIKIPSSVKSIGSGAFSGCENLNSVTLVDGITSIGKGAFVDCTLLLSISVPASVTEMDYAFSVTYSLTNVTLADGLTSIGMGTFAGCTGLTSINIPTSILSIGSLAFFQSWLFSIQYDSTKEDWGKIELGEMWHSSKVTVHCSDGDIEYQ